MEYDYSYDIAQALLLLPQLNGALLLKVRVHVVAEDFNVVYLDTDRGVFAIQGEMGGEFLGLKKLETLPESIPADGYYITEHLPFQVFEGKKIHSVRQIGEAWNGHGLELSFEGEFSRTMIVQSIDAGDVPAEFEDCLRLGVGEYKYRAKAIL